METVSSGLDDGGIGTEIIEALSKLNMMSLYFFESMLFLIANEVPAA